MQDSYLVGRPGMVGMSPTNGNKKPAPHEARISRIGKTKPSGAPGPHTAHHTYHIITASIHDPTLATPNSVPL